MKWVGAQYAKFRKKFLAFQSYKKVFIIALYNENALNIFIFIY